jgi:peptide/nickel transport system substrate-binding protein/oligopeptide transport system substrate-binding protein
VRPVESDVLNIAGETEDPPTLDPALASDSYSHFIIRQLFSGLVAFNDKLEVVSDLATGLPQVSPDGKTYTFTLRRGVRFTNGQEVTSTDFKYSFERATNPRLAGAQPPTALPAALYLGDIVGVKEKLAGAVTEIRGVQAPDPYTLVLTIDAPKAYFLSKLTSGPAFVVQRANVEKSAAWTEEPVGTGPYRLLRWQHNQHMVLASNPDYYGGEPQIRTINIYMGANATGQLGQYESADGALDVAGVSVDDLDRVTDRNNPISRELLSVPDLSITYLGFNLRQKPFDDPKVREALARAVDRQKIARVMFQSRVRAALGFVPPNLGSYPSPARDDQYNVSRARQLLSESTYRGAENLPRLRLYTAGDSVGPTLREVYSQTLGIDVEVIEIEWADFLAGLDKAEYPMFITSWGADYPDPESFLGSLFRSGSPANFSGYRNADVDSALNLAASETDEERRMATYAQVESRVLADYPSVPLFHSVTYTLVKPYIKGFTITPMGILSLRDVRIEGR